MMIFKEFVSLKSIRKKIIVLSKVFGILLILSYIFSLKLPFNSDIIFLIWTVFLIILILFIDFLLAKFISQPISKICDSADKMSNLDFSTPCSLKSNDEFGKISKSLNKMASNLQNSISKLEEMNYKLEKDIQRERILLDERKELVDNLSHEMKTPLGVIRAYAEGIQDIEDEERKSRYCDVIISETERMNELINTLLDLSALEKGATFLNITEFDFVELVETIAGRLLIDAPDVNFELQYVLPENSCIISSDKSRMEQVVGNLLMNAKKNVIPNGILKLSLIENVDNIYFSVFNQGNNISEEDFSKIWSKFYRNKNSKYSGSGLGLSIVAQVLSMQNIEYGVKNLNDGVEFYFIIQNKK